MRNVGRKLAFVLAASNHGTMILNRFDYRMSGPDQGVSASASSCSKRAASIRSRSNSRCS